MRMIVDCERDVKGVHTWSCIGITSASEGDYVLWCPECGAVGVAAVPKVSHPKEVYITNRVKEKVE